MIWYIFVGGSIQATTNGNVASLELNYQTVGSGDLLMMSLPHHQELLDSSVMKNEIMFDSLKVNSTQFLIKLFFLKDKKSYHKIVEN